MTGRKRHTSTLGAVVSALILTTAWAGTAFADDTDLFRETTAEPYVFFLLDVSGSMNQSIPCSAEQAIAGTCGGPACTQAQIDAGRCATYCPTGACLPRLMGDDLNSRLGVAKQAIYEMVDEAPDIQYGFAQFGRSGLQLSRKHWYYRPAEVQPANGSGLPVGFITLESGRVFPGPDHEDVFGDTWSCETFSKSGARTHQCQDEGYNCDRDRERGCNTTFPANLDDPWDYEKIRRLPKLDDENDEDVTFYIRDTDGAVYEVEYNNVASLSGARATALGVSTDPELGEPRVPVRIDVDCVSGCSTFGFERSYIVFEEVSETVYWEPVDGIRRQAPSESFFGFATRAHGGNAGGIERNNDNDAVGGVNLLVETIADPQGRGNAYSVGDLIPFDWLSNQATLLQARMAPNVLLPGQAGRPDFGIATYLVDHRSQRLAPRDPDDYLDNIGETAAATAFRNLPQADQDRISGFFRPLIPQDITPTGAAVQQWENWLRSWLQEATRDESLGGDPEIGCRQIYLVVLSDGLANDGQSACAQAASLRNLTVNGQEFDVRTFGIAFGRRAEDFDLEKQITGRDNVFECIADVGGTDTDDDLDGDGVADGPGVLFPQNKDELVAALLDAIELVRPQPRTLTGVAVPSVQAESADQVFLTDFTPLNTQAIWPGQIHQFVKPLPLDDQDRPDFAALCSDIPAGDPVSACYVGDVAQVMLDTQVRPSTADPVGNNAAQRRVYYSLFQDARGDTDGGAVPRQRLFFEPIDMSTSPQVRNDLLFGFDLDPADAGAVVQANATVDQVLAIKTVTLPDGTDVEYVLGDVFHSDPLLIGAPSNNTYFIQDAGADLDEPCGAGNRGYRCFARTHATRRRALYVAANDGMLHAFDVGSFQVDAGRGPLGGFFDNGSGKELFAYMPRPALAKLREVFETGKHDFTVDGQMTAADVFVDPIHSVQLGDPPDADDREWRTLMLGSMRRGGGSVGDLDLPALPAGLPANPVARAEAVELLDAQEVSAYFALDVTQPDPLSSSDDLPEVPAGGQPGCAGNADGGGLAAGCSNVAYGMPLWEFSDSFRGILLDEDGDGLADLGPTWSAANLGRMQVCTANCGLSNQVIEDRYVSVFGGGIDVERRGRGDWLYIVDVETGQAIYKQQLDGEAPAEPAAVDVDLDGYLDRIYAGTVNGFLYRVDLRHVIAGVLVYPELATVPTPITVTGRQMQDLDGDGVFEPVSHPWSPRRITGALYEPVKVFDAGKDDGEVRPIFYRPAIFYVPEINEFAVAFGTGERENLFERMQPSGRFFTFVDEIDDLPALVEPLGPADLLEIDRDFNVAGQSGNLLLDRPPGSRGWWIDLGVNERLITDPFALAGILIFSTYQPTGLDPSEALCREQGQSRIFGVLSTNGNGIMRAGGARSRYISTSDFVTSPFTEQSQTKNPPSGNSNRKTADQLTDPLREIMRELQGLFPPNCRFQEGYRIDVKARASDTGMIFIAPVPICVIEKNFKEWDTP
ncbi:MAG TPA: PilC/PilY family type IV pilus protein [Thermoanaerobaculia bacterium]|nr:PilC/PilY family type IV pilus protein [Thermoanaerobaculia bacterium]